MNKISSKFSSEQNNIVSFFNIINNLFKEKINRYGYILRDSIFDNKYEIYKELSQLFIINKSKIDFKEQNIQTFFNIKNSDNTLTKSNINIDFMTEDTIYYIVPLVNRNSILPVKEYMNYLSHILMYLTEKKLCKLVFIKFNEYGSEKSYNTDKNAIDKGSYQIDSKNIYWKLDDINIISFSLDEDYIFRLFSIISRQILKIGNQKLFRINNKMGISKKRNFSELDNNSIANRVSRKNKRKRVAEHLGENYQEWVSPSETRNYLLNDTILDWFKYYGEMNGYKKDTNFNCDYDYFKFLMDRGNEYENFVIEDLKKRFPNDIEVVSPPGSYFSFDNVKITNQMMEKGVPIIYQANLQSADSQIYGIADLIVRSDLIQNYFAIPSEITLKDVSDKTYFVVDIKFSTIHEDIHGLIKNKGSIKCYKGQIYLYNKILEDKFNQTLQYGFILGRRFIDKKGIVNDGKTHLGVIDYQGKDKEIVEKSLEAIDWLKWVRQYGKEHDPKDSTLKCFLPNMNNRLDYPWHNMKKQLATDKKDLTLLWCCGVKNRDIAINNGIYSFEQKGYKTSKLGLSDKQSSVVRKIVKANRKNKKLLYGKNSINTIDLNSKLRFFVDFEFINTNDITFDINSRVHLYMIGIGHINPLTQKWEFENLVTKHIDEISEESICKEFLKYIYQKKMEYQMEDAILIHWSKAEPSLFNKLQNKYNLVKEIEWYDLLETFREQPITQCGVYDFGLKNVAKNLKKNGYIETEWNSSVMDGLGASMAIINGLKETDNLNEISEIDEIKYYNEIDCKVLSDIYKLITYK